MRNQSLKKPPAVAKWLLSFLLNNNHPETVLADFEEIYFEVSCEKGKTRANCWYLWQIVATIPSFVNNTIYWSAIMFFSYLKSGLRILLKHRGYSFINISGLATGMACAILILLFLHHETSYDTFHEKADQIYRVAVKAVIGDTRIAQTHTPAILSPIFLRDYPEVGHAVRFGGGDAQLVQYENRVFNETRVVRADSGVFDVFTLPFVKGDSRTALTQPNSVVISESIATKYFDDGDPINRVIRIDTDDFRVTGVMEDIPDNSHFHFDFLLSLSTFPYSRSTHWFANNFRTYIVLRKGVTQEAFEAKFPDLVRMYLWENRNYDEWVAKGIFWEYFLQPLTGIHLNSDLSGEFEANGNATYIAIFSIIALFVLSLAVINYMNLSTANPRIGPLRLASAKSWDHSERVSSSNS